MFDKLYSSAITHDIKRPATDENPEIKLLMIFNCDWPIVVVYATSLNIIISSG